MVSSGVGVEALGRGDHLYKGPGAEQLDFLMLRQEGSVAGAQ